LNKGTLAPDAGGSGLAIHGLTGSSAASVTFQSGSTFHLTLANSAGDGNAPLAADFSYLNLDHGGAVMIAPGSLLSITTGVVHTGDLFTVILNGGGGDIEGVFNNSTSTLVADSTYSFSSDGMAWYINYEYDGSLSFSASGINPTAFSQITGGNSVAILAMAPGVPGSAIVSEPSSSALVPEPGSCVSLLGGISLLLGLPRFRRRRS